MLAAASHFEESRRAAIERFQRVLQDPRQAEERFVAEVLRANAATVFGREHGFDKVRTLEDFRSAVPIRDYDALESWLERAAAGEPAVLTQESPLGFRRTSGTTKESKKIPITRRVLDPEFPAWAACMGAAFDLAPELRTSDSDRVLNVTLNPRGRPTVLPTGALWQSYSEHFARLAGPGDPLYGFRPMMTTLVDRLKVSLDLQCLPHALTRASNGSAPCRVLATLSNPGDESVCPAFGLQVPDANTLRRTRDSASQLPLCLVPQLSGADLDATGGCASSSTAGWCYATGAAAGGCPQRLLFSPAGVPLGATLKITCAQGC